MPASALQNQNPTRHIEGGNNSRELDDQTCLNGLIVNLMGIEPTMMSIDRYNGDEIVMRDEL